MSPSVCRCEWVRESRIGLCQFACVALGARTSAKER